MSKRQREDSRLRHHPTRFRAALFLIQVRSFANGGRLSISQFSMKSRSSLARTHALRTDYKREIEKTRLPSNGGHENGKNACCPNLARGDPRIDLEL